MKEFEKLIEVNLNQMRSRETPKVLKVLTDPDIKLPAWAIGPFDVNESLSYKKTEQWKPAFKGDSWQSKAIFNPTLIEKDGELNMIYRASPEMESLDSRLGLATFKNGKWEDYKNNPILFKTTDDENLGIEDPKLYFANGKYYLFYNAVCLSPTPEGEMPLTEYGDTYVDICLAVSDNLIDWDKKGVIVPREITRGVAKGAVIPRNGKGEAVKINGQYYMFITAGCGGRTVLGRSKDMENWTYEFNPFLDLSKYGHIEEAACCTTEEDWDYFILDVYYIDINYNQLGTQVYYSKQEPFIQKKLTNGATFSWGGLMKFNDKWTFAQGWDSDRSEEKMLFYVERDKK